VLSTPVDIDDDTIAAITVYTRAPGAIDNALQLVVALLAEHAGLLLANVLRRANRPRAGAAQAGSEVIHRATGMIMVQRGCPPDEALRILHQAAAAAAMTVPQIARRLTDTALG
jgi:hypothetical protein